MDHSIANLFFKGYIDREEAVAKSTNPAKMNRALDEGPKPEVKRSNDKEFVKV
jgi:hypothetical protein